MASTPRFPRSIGASRLFTIGDRAAHRDRSSDSSRRCSTSNPDLASTLKETSGRSGTGRRQHRARSVLVVAEMALALVLLIGATLLIRTFVGLRTSTPASTRTTC